MDACVSSETSKSTTSRVLTVSFTCLYQPVFHLDLFLFLYFNHVCYSCDSLTSQETLNNLVTCPYVSRLQSQICVSQLQSTISERHQASCLVLLYWHDANTTVTLQKRISFFTEIFESIHIPFSLLLRHLKTLYCQ